MSSANALSFLSYCLVFLFLSYNILNHGSPGETEQTVDCQVQIRSSLRTGCAYDTRMDIDDSGDCETRRNWFGIIFLFLSGMRTWITQEFANLR